MQFDTKYFVHIIGLENASCPCWLKPKLILMLELELELELMWMWKRRMNMCLEINFSFGPDHFSPHRVSDFEPSSSWVARIDSSIGRVCRLLWARNANETLALLTSNNSIFNWARGVKMCLPLPHAGCRPMKLCLCPYSAWTVGNRFRYVFISSTKVAAAADGFLLHFNFFAFFSFGLIFRRELVEKYPKRNYPV